MESKRTAPRPASDRLAAAVRSEDRQTTVAEIRDSHSKSARRGIDNSGWVYNDAAWWTQAYSYPRLRPEESRTSRREGILVLLAHVFSTVLRDFWLFTVDGVIRAGAG